MSEYIEKGKLIDYVQDAYGGGNEDNTCIWYGDVIEMIRSEPAADVMGDEYDLDKLRQLAQADREGRCVVLPCKVGDTVYFITGMHNSLIKSARVNEIYIGDEVFALGVSTDFTTFTLQESEWYLTREAAEASLKGE